MESRNKEAAGPLPENRRTKQMNVFMPSQAALFTLSPLTFIPRSRSEGKCADGRVGLRVIIKGILFQCSKAATIKPSLVSEFKGCRRRASHSRRFGCDKGVSAA